MYIAIYLFAVFISSCSQILLKKSSNKIYNSKVREYLNAYVIIAYGIFFLSTFLNIIAYKELSVSTACLLETTGYIYTLFFGKIFFNENISINKILGMIFIFFGVIITIL